MTIGRYLRDGARGALILLSMSNAVHAEPPLGPEPPIGRAEPQITWRVENAFRLFFDEVRALLKARGFDRKQIISEKYD